MKNSLSHLPLIKQQELHEIVQLIYQMLQAEMIILFGSYARGDWVEEYADDGVHFQDQSDFDLLVIVETRSVSEQARLQREIKKAVRQLPYSLILYKLGGGMTKIFAALVMMVFSTGLYANTLNLSQYFAGKKWLLYFIQSEPKYISH